MRDSQTAMWREPNAGGTAPRAAHLLGRAADGCAEHRVQHPAAPCHHKHPATGLCQRRGHVPVMQDLGSFVLFSQ